MTKQMRPKTFDDILAEGSALAEERAAQGIKAPIQHRRSRMTWRQFLAIVSDAYNETKTSWTHRA